MSKNQEIGRDIQNSFFYIQDLLKAPFNAFQVHFKGSGCGVGRAGDGAEAEDERAEGNHFEES